MLEITDLDGIPTLLVTSRISRLKVDQYGQQSFTPLTEAEERAAALILENHVRTALAANFGIQSDNYVLAQRRGYSYVEDPGLLVKPVDRYSDVNIKNGKPHKDFQKRKLAGEIMVSDYERSVIRVRQSPAYVVNGPRNIPAYLSMLALVQNSLVTQIRDTSTVAFSGYGIRGGLNDHVAEYRRIESETGGRWVYPSPVSANEVLQGCRDHILDPTSLVTNVTAKANRSSVDILTAAAELPKSIRSFIGFAKSIVKILADVRKRKFTVSEGFAKRKKSLTKRYEGRMRRLDKELSSKTISVKRRTALLHEQARIRVRFTRALSDTSIELADALADVWMTYRYEIMTNVYLAQDIYDALDQYAREFVTSAGTARNGGTLHFGERIMDIHTTLRCLIKRRFSLATAKQGRSVMSSDLFVTAWELVPLSYVYDWFINFGDLLSSQSYNYAWAEQGSTLARKITFDAHLEDPPIEGAIIDSVTIVSGFYYKRQVINPQDYCGLVWQPQLGLVRQLDAAALLWRPVRSLILNSRGNIR